MKNNLYIFFFLSILAMSVCKIDASSWQQIMNNAKNEKSLNHWYSDWRNDLDKTLLNAAYYGNHDIVKIALKEGADANATMQTIVSNHKPWTPLSYVIHYALQPSLTKKYTPIIETILTHKNFDKTIEYNEKAIKKALDLKGTNPVRIAVNNILSPKKQEETPKKITKQEEKINKTIKDLESLPYFTDRSKPQNQVKNKKKIQHKKSQLLSLINQASDSKKLQKLYTFVSSESNKLGLLTENDINEINTSYQKKLEHLQLKEVKDLIKNKDSLKKEIAELNEEEVKLKNEIKTLKEMKKLSKKKKKKKNKLETELLDVTLKIVTQTDKMNKITKELKNEEYIKIHKDILKKEEEKIRKRKEEKKNLNQVINQISNEWTKRPIRKVLKQNTLDTLVNINGRNETVLHYAVRSSNIDLMNILIEKGADPYIKDENNQTPLHLANRLNIDQSIINLLQKYQAKVAKIKKKEIEKKLSQLKKSFGEKLKAMKLSQLKKSFRTKLQTMLEKERIYHKRLKAMEKEEEKWKIFKKSIKELPREEKTKKTTIPKQAIDAYLLRQKEGQKREMPLNIEPQKPLSSQGQISREKILEAANRRKQLEIDRRKKKNLRTVQATTKLIDEWSESSTNLTQKYTQLTQYYRKNLPNLEDSDYQTMNKAYHTKLNTLEKKEKRELEKQENIKRLKKWQKEGEEEESAANIRYSKEKTKLKNENEKVLRDYLKLEEQEKQKKLKAFAKKLSIHNSLENEDAKLEQERQARLEKEKKLQNKKEILDEPLTKEERNLLNKEFNFFKQTPKRETRATSLTKALQTLKEKLASLATALGSVNKII